VAGNYLTADRGMPNSVPKVKAIFFLTHFVPGKTKIQLREAPEQITVTALLLFSWILSNTRGWFSWFPILSASLESTLVSTISSILVS
jgi:hypothetical protein